MGPGVICIPVAAPESDINQNADRSVMLEAQIDCDDQNLSMVSGDEQTGSSDVEDEHENVFEPRRSERQNQSVLPVRYRKDYVFK